MQPPAIFFTNMVFPIITAFLAYIQPMAKEILPLDQKVKHVQDLNASYDAVSEFPVLDFVGLVNRHGYKGEQYVINSTDGYILKLHRIVGGPVLGNAAQKPVVYIQHGILLSSDSWVLIGPKTDLAFLLSDAGFDVWIGNVRGNTYSQTHTNKNLPPTDFWKFGYHEMAVYDVRAFIDFICETTKQEQITYIGYSMGTTISFAFLSTFPQYNAKIKAVHSIAPVVFWDYALRPIPAAMNEIWWLIDAIADYFKLLKVFPQTAAAAFLGQNYCKDSDVTTQPLCIKMMSGVGIDTKRMNTTALPDIFAHFPAGTSMTTVNHYHQNFVRHTFQAFDYGPEENKIKYNQTEPPTYNLTEVTAPVYIWYAKNDDIVNYQDVYTLSKALPNVKAVTEVQLDRFNHFDFLWARDVKELVYDHVISKIKED